MVLYEYLRKAGFFTLILLIVPFSLSAQTTDSLLKEAQHLVLQQKEAQALEKYKLVLSLDSNNVKALSASSILTTRQGLRQSSNAEQENIFKQARTFAESALRHNSNNAEANIAMAKALNQLALRSGAKGKINLLRDVKIYTDKAIMIDSGYARAWHVLGKWNMELSTLNFAERTAAKLLFGGMPDASLDKAIADFKKCSKLEPSFILNFYDLAKAYHAKGKDLEAIATLKHAIHLRPILQDDRDIQQKCRDMIEKLK